MSEPIAYVGMACGRWFLRVNGVVVAMETDPCRDSGLEGNRWDEKNLHEAAERINALKQGVLEFGR